MSRVRLDRALTSVSSPNRGNDLEVDYPKMVKDLRAKLQLAGEMGKALLETNASITAEKNALRDSLDLAVRRGDKTAGEVSELMHENDDLRKRLASLRAELSRFEASNMELGKSMEELQRQLAARVPERKETDDHESEKLLTRLDEEEQKNALLNLQLNRTRVEADRFRDQAAQLEERNAHLSFLLEEASKNSQEHVSLQQHCKKLESGF